MAVAIYKVTVEGERIRVTKSLTGRSKTIMVTSPEKIIGRIGGKVYARSHIEVLRMIADLEADEVVQDIALCDFAEWSGKSKKTIAESCECGFLPGPHVLAAWMNSCEIDNLARRRIVWYLLAVRSRSDAEWDQLIIDFKDVFDDHTKYLVPKDE